MYSFYHLSKIDQSNSQDVVQAQVRHENMTVLVYCDALISVCPFTDSWLEFEVHSPSDPVRETQHNRGRDSRAKLTREHLRPGAGTAHVVFHCIAR